MSGHLSAVVFQEDILFNDLIVGAPGPDELCGGSIMGLHQVKSIHGNFFYASDKGAQFLEICGEIIVNIQI